MFPATRGLRSIGLVVTDESGLASRLTDYLSGGCRVHVLGACGIALSKSTVLELTELGVRWSELDRSDCPAEFEVPNLYPASPADRSDRIRYTLERLVRRHRFDSIEFDVGQGSALRTIQAKHAGLAFADVILTLRLDTCQAWQREREQRWPASYEEVEIDFAERFSFENADLQLAVDPDLLAFVHRLGWRFDVTAVDRSYPASLPPQSVSVSADTSMPMQYPLVTIGIAYYNLGQYLPATLASLAAQTYPNLEVLVIDDGSADPESVETFSLMEQRFPQYRFIRQSNAGIGAARNRCLSSARGEYFIPVDADNIARPDMVARFVEAMARNPSYDAMTCYFLAFEDDDKRLSGKFLHACRPLGGPYALAGIRNVYGDANAVFRTEAFRAVGGYEIDRGTSCEDWEAFVKLIHAGSRIGVIPDYLFFYRHLTTGFSRKTNRFANHQRVLRQFVHAPRVPANENMLLWTTLLGFHGRIEQLRSERTLLRYRIADAVHARLSKLPGFLRIFKYALLRIGNLWSRLFGKRKEPPSSEPTKRDLPEEPSPAAEPSTGAARNTAVR